MASCIVRSISRSAGFCNWKAVAAKSLIRGRVAPISTKNVDNFPNKSVGNYFPNSVIKTTPWLILPPAVKDNNMVYKFYSLTENKVISINKREGKEEEEAQKLGLAPDDDADFVGSSQGWLVLCNKRNHDLFLSNPLTRRHIKLPSIHTLTIPDEDLARPGGHGVKKVVISGSPDDENCHAMMAVGPSARLVACRPGRSKEWNTTSRPDHYVGGGRDYEDYIYCSNSSAYNLFGRGVPKKFMLCYATPFFELWDMEDPESPELRYLNSLSSLDNYDYCDYWTEEELAMYDGRMGKESAGLENMCRPLTCFVEYEDQLYAVFRYVMERVRPDGSYVNPGTTVVDVDFPHKTVGFHVYKTKLSALKMYYMERGSIDGLAMFIGRNHSFALSARDYPELKPDSIYYTEAKEFVGDDSVENYGGHDVGIFNYRDKTFSSCYYPCDVQSIKRIVPAPMWFTPSPF